MSGINIISKSLNSARENLIAHNPVRRNLISKGNTLEHLKIKSLFYAYRSQVKLLNLYQKQSNKFHYLKFNKTKRR